MRVKEDLRKLVSNNNADEFSGQSYGSVFLEENSSYYESEESSSNLRLHRERITKKKKRLKKLFL